MWIFSYDETDLTLVKCWHHCQPKHIRSAIFATLVTVVMSVVPAGTAALVLSISSAKYEWADFVKNGEVAIFCVGLLTTSLLLTAKELQHPFAHRQLFVFLSIGLVIFSTACYAGSSILSAQSKGALPNADTAELTVNPSSSSVKLAIVASAVLYIVTIILSSVVAFVDEVRESLPTSLAAKATAALQSNESLRTQFHSIPSEDEADGE